MYIYLYIYIYIETLSRRTARRDQAIQLTAPHLSGTVCKHKNRLTGTPTERTRRTTVDRHSFPTRGTREAGDWGWGAWVAAACYLCSACSVFQVQPVATRGENRMNKKSQTLLG